MPTRLLWLLLAAPSLALAAAATRATADLDALTATSGDSAAMLLGAALAVTPVARLMRARPAMKLRRNRRAIGLAAFAACLVHLGIYLAAMGEFVAVRAEIGAPGIWTGWAALLLLLPLALTSTDAAMRRLGRNWHRLHRLVWPAALLVLVHWALVHDGRAAAIAAALGLATLQLARFSPRHLQRKSA